MPFDVKCECGKKVNVYFTEDNISLSNKSHEILLGKGKCSNPLCNKTIFVSANITINYVDTEKYINSKVNWEGVKVGSTVYVDKCLYKIALKSIRTIRTEDNLEVPLSILYLRSSDSHYNVVGEVVNDGSIVLMYGKEEPLTPAGYESWNEEKLKTIINKSD